MISAALAVSLLSAVPKVDLTGMVIYEVNLRAHGSTGGFEAVRKRLPAIQQTGCTVLWLMPIHPVGRERSAGGLGSPYAVRDYRAVNPEFGTQADFRRLVSDAQGRGMKVILDWVANHTAWDHAWMQRPEWYARDADGKVLHPPGTNWLDVAELNYDSAQMRAEMISEMRRWVVEEGIDGFRCDFAEGVPVSFWREAVATLRAAANQRPLLMLAEGAKSDLVTEGGFDLTYDWEAFGLVKDIFGGKKSARDFVPAMARTKHPTLKFITNHDEAAWSATVKEHFGSNESGLAALTALSFSGGVPLVYSSQEVGYDQRLPFFTTTNVDWTQSPLLQAGYRRMLSGVRSFKVGPAPTLEDRSTDRVVFFRATGARGAASVAVNTSGDAQTLRSPGIAWGFTGEIRLNPYETRRWNLRAPMRIDERVGNEGIE
jgi:hypothetical protein